MEYVLSLITAVFCTGQTNSEEPHGQHLRSWDSVWWAPDREKNSESPQIHVNLLQGIFTCVFIFSYSTPIARNQIYNLVILKMFSKFFYHLSNLFFDFINEQLSLEKNLSWDMNKHKTSSLVKIQRLNIFVHLWYTNKQKTSHKRLTGINLHAIVIFSLEFISKSYLSWAMVWWVGVVKNDGQK